MRGMAEKDTYISIAGQQPTVTLVSNGTMTSRRPGTGIARQVLVTPLTKSNPANTTIQQQGVFAAQTRSSLNFPPSSSASQQHAANKVDKVLLKAVNKKGKKDPKTFTLRNVDQHALLTSDDLKRVIRMKLSDDITSGDFDVGYVQGTTVVRLRTSEDLEELWSLLRQSQKNTVLWCDGLIARAGHKRKHSDDEDDSDTEQQQSRRSRSKKQDTNVQVQDTVEQLKAKYGSNYYTQMQFRIWAELVVGGMCGMDGPPSNNSMFKRAGAGASDGATKKNETRDVTQTLTNVITAALSAKDNQESQQLTPRSSMSISSPAKLIENRSKLYKQLSELKNLKGCGVLDEEYAVEKATIMDLLKQLSSKSN